MNTDGLCDDKWKAIVAGLCLMTDVLSACFGDLVCAFIDCLMWAQSMLLFLNAKHFINVQASKSFFCCFFSSEKGLSIESSEAL